MGGMILKDYLHIGTVLKPQGVRGQCKIQSYASDPAQFSRWTCLYLFSDGEYRPVHLETDRIQDHFIFAHLDHSATVEEAEAFRGQELFIDRAHAAQPGKDACLIADLIGCSARDENGEVIGTLTDVLQHGSVDTWVFKSVGGTLMAPALKAVFPAVDPENGIISVCRERLEEVAVRESIS